MADDGVTLMGRIKEKLIASKQKWAREERLITGEASSPDESRLPPGQRLVTSWPVLDLGVQPNIDRDRWKLVVDGLVGKPMKLDWKGFSELPQVDRVSDIHCVTAWSRYENHWQGVTARHLLGLVEPKPEARFVIFHSFDGYTTNVPLPMFNDDDVLLAHSWEGEPLPREHGGPVRIVIPKRYFWKSAKWVGRIEFTDEDRPGFWEIRGYHNEGDPWEEERYG